MPIIPPEKPKQFTPDQSSPKPEDATQSEIDALNQAAGAKTQQEETASNRVKKNNRGTPLAPFIEIK